MATYDLPRMQTGGNTFGNRLSALYTTFLSWNDARATRRALSKLSDHELEDIGLVRGDIDTILRR
ncbi:MAG: DUF1127 domain-containing protein [Pseudomonadota bacterium]